MNSSFLAAMGESISEQLLRVVFLPFCGEKRYCSNHTKKLDKSLLYFFDSIEKWQPKIGYYSN